MQPTYDTLVVADKISKLGIFLQPSIWWSQILCHTSTEIVQMPDRAKL